MGFLNDEPFGVIYFNIFSTGNDDPLRVELGYFLVREDLINSGYGALMEFFALYYVFEILEKAQNAFCRTLKENSKILRLHERFGFSRTHEGFVNGAKFILQEISKEKWFEKKPEVEKILKRVFTFLKHTSDYSTIFE